MIIGVMVVVITLIWVGASDYFQKGSFYAAYFDESVQGLQVDSGVKYLGVDVGRVMKIRVAPDNNLIEVIMKIDFKSKPEYTTTATLKMGGLTGIVYVELDKRKIKDVGLSPKLTFPAEYPVIPSRPSDIRQITTSVDEIIGNIKKIDFIAIAGQARSTIGALEKFITDDKMKKIITNLESTTASLEGVAAKVNTALERGNLEEILVETKSVVTEARKLVERTRSEVEALKVKETGERAAMVVEEADRKIRSLSSEVHATMENVRQLTESLEELVERLRADPSDLLFSEPPPRR